MYRKTDLVALAVSIVSASVVALYLALKPSGENVYLTAMVAAISAGMAFLARGWPRVFCSTVAVESGAASLGLALKPDMLEHLTFTSCCPSDPVASTFMAVMLLLAPIQVYALLRSIL
jgi:hypothetical protein